MQRIDEKYFAIESTVTVATKRFPIVQSVDYNCPNCSRLVNFPLGWSIPQGQPLCLITKSRCSGCGEFSKFIFIDYESPKGNEMGNLYIHPDPDRRDSIFDFDQIKSKYKDELKLTYESTLNVFNSGEWNGTTVLARRLLEGITYDILPEDVKSTNLSKRLSEIPNHVDLQKPIVTLNEALRKSGNLGAHFDAQKKSNKKIATQMLNLLDYLIEYIYILPNRIEELHSEIKSKTR